MSTWVIAVFAALGASAWFFTKLQDRTGRGNNRAAVTGGIVAFVVVFIVVLTLGLTILPKN